MKSYNGSFYNFLLILSNNILSIVFESKFSIMTFSWIQPITYFKHFLKFQKTQTPRSNNIKSIEEIHIFIKITILNVLESVLVRAKK